MIKKGLMFFVIVASLLASCKKRGNQDVDISEIEINIEIKRLDKDIFEIDLGNVPEGVGDLINKYGEFFELYNNRVINLGNPYSNTYSDILTGFVTDYTMNKVYKKTMEVYPDLNILEFELENGFKRYKYYFPEKIVPAFYTYIGGFNQSIVVSDSILGIGIDKYLGSDCVFYDRLGIANYMQHNMIPEMIPLDAVKAWALTEFDYNDSVDNVVNNMIYHGKIQYFLDVMFPETTDSIKYGFSGDEIQWCINNEKQMWDFLIDQKMLFSTDYMMINKLINPAPFTAGFPNESPGRATVWLGCNIVEAYMNKHSEVSIKDLMLENDYQKILSESRYEP